MAQSTRAASGAALLVACGGSFLAFLDVTIANLALPAVGLDFEQPDLARLSWIVTLYTVVFAAALAPAGRLADVVGRRRLFMVGMAIFTVGSLGASLAPELVTLLVARGVQGLGAALLLPASLGLVLAAVAPERRAAAVGLWSASAAAAAALGPALGGVLVDELDWRWLFCINVPIGAWLLYRTSRLPDIAPSSRRWPDLLSTVALAAGVLGLVVGITQSNTWEWDDSRTVLCVVAGIALCVVAALRSRDQEHPAIPGHLWRSRRYTAANVVSLLFGGVLFAWLLVGVLFLTSVWHYSELRAGLAMTPGALVAALVGVSVSRSRRAVSPAALVATGSTAIGVSGFAMALWLPAQPHFAAVWLPVGILIGAGMGAVSVGVSSAAALSVPPTDFAAGTGLNVAVRQIGGAVGVAAMTAVLGDDALFGADATPFRHVYLMCAVLSSVVVAVAWFLSAPRVTIAPAREVLEALEAEVAR